MKRRGSPGPAATRNTFPMSRRPSIRFAVATWRCSGRERHGGKRAPLGIPTGNPFVCRSEIAFRILAARASGEKEIFYGMDGRVSPHGAWSSARLTLCGYFLLERRHQAALDIRGDRL